MSADGPPLITARGLTKTFNTFTAVDGINDMSESLTQMMQAIQGRDEQLAGG